ncbi:MAG: hypothetical protein CMK74_15900 [Pseudomonadales bacterium]|nr:hypothetical protein [Pseudomonadales bacterium]|tara:strand:- start:3914 stop:4309 length:396 start_codon:yes stop_codon:yes gene_type:complete
MVKNWFGDLSKILGFAALVEAGTAVLLLIDPSILILWLLGLDASAMGILLGRFFGCALLALGLACWPAQQASSPSPAWPAFCAMLLYNTLAALYLAYLGVFVSSGWLLWPAFTLHILIVLLLVFPWRTEQH